MGAPLLTFQRRNTNDCADLRALRSSRSESGYLNVYWKCKSDDGVNVWVCKVKVARTLQTIPNSQSADVRECARRVAAWYAEHFGPHWREVLSARKCNPFAVRYSARHGGYLACAWVLGQREEVVHLRRVYRDRWAPTDALAVFATAADARAGVREYLLKRFGLFSEVVCWRTKPAGERFAARAA